MEEKQFSLICIKRVGSNKVVSFKENKDYEIDSIKPGIPGEGTEELIVIDELGNKHIVATDRERIWKRDKWFNEHFEIVNNS
ncbi:hypothetical protein [Clostridium butyricum]|uniref:hypothetical protein n=1 Tax=Clostridium butyricum TaxID=1492 RepID=UPI00374EF7C2